jgi:hypothetical protein
VLKQYSIIFLFFFCLLTAKSQPTLDTIKDCLKQRPQLFAKFDGRNSFVENSRAKIFGIKGGVSFGKRLHFGIGYNQLQPPTAAFDKTTYLVNNNGYLYAVIRHLHMYYFSVHAEYIFFKVKHWELSMPLQFGIGKSYYSSNLPGFTARKEETLNFIYEPAISIEYKFVKWCGIGADVGYRFMFTSDKHLNANFTSPTYAFKFLIYYSEIFKSVSPKSKLAGKM